MLSKLAGIVTDRRNPLFLPTNYLEKKRLERLIRGTKVPTETRVELALTFDVEYDFGSAGSRTLECAGPFLDRIASIPNDKKIHATFFVQGNLVASFSDQLRSLEGKGHEIGLHGWAHEPWGESWFVKDRVPPLHERDILLRKCLEAFEENGIRKPVSFRAPNMVIDNDSLRLLKRHGFKVDSSAASYKGAAPLITKSGGMVEVPVSADPIPEFTGKASAVFHAMNMHNIGEIAEISQNVVRFQLAHGAKPFLVFLAHPWEFSGNKKFGYCSDGNYERLSRALDDLSKLYKLTFVTMDKYGSHPKS